jgi:hypothetical protein
MIIFDFITYIRNTRSAFGSESQPGHAISPRPDHDDRSRSSSSPPSQTGQKRHPSEELTDESSHSLITGKRPRTSGKTPALRPQASQIHELASLSNSKSESPQPETNGPWTVKPGLGKSHTVWPEGSTSIPLALPGHKAKDPNLPWGTVPAHISEPGHSSPNSQTSGSSSGSARSRSNSLRSSSRKPLTKADQKLKS